MAINYSMSGEVRSSGRHVSRMHCISYDQGYQEIRKSMEVVVVSGVQGLLKRSSLSTKSIHWTCLTKIVDRVFRRCGVHNRMNAPGNSHYRNLFTARNLFAKINSNLDVLSIAFNIFKQSSKLKEQPTLFNRIKRHAKATCSQPIDFNIKFRWVFIVQCTPRLFTFRLSGTVVTVKKHVLAFLTRFYLDV